MTNAKQTKTIHIVSAAAHVFADNGYTATRMADVARAAGIGKGTIYEYFRSKEDLFFAIFQWLTEDTAELNIDDMSGTVAKQLEQISDRVIKKWLDQLPFYSLTLEFWSAANTPALKNRFKQAFKEMYRNFRLAIATILRDGIRRGEFSENIDTDALAAAMVGSWDALILQAWFDHKFDALATSRRFLKVLIAGLKNT